MQRNRFGIWRDIKHLSLADTSQMTGRHVANGVGTGFARGEIHFCKTAHHRSDIAQIDKM